MLFWSWASVVDGGPAPEQHWFDSWLLSTVFYHSPQRLIRSVLIEISVIDREYPDVIVCKKGMMYWENMEIDHFYSNIFYLLNKKLLFGYLLYGAEALG